MCIAIIKPKRLNLPTYDLLENCWDNNPHGAGISFNHNEQILIFKGLMTFKNFKDKLNELNEKYNLKNKTVFLHFRIATHGGTNKEMTHPFPLTSNIDYLKASNLITDFAVIHNGIIDLTNEAKHISDTALFIQKYLYDFTFYDNWFSNSNTINLIEKLIGSKMAIMNKAGEFIKTNGFHEFKGIYYSNEAYIKRQPFTKKYTQNSLNYSTSYETFSNIIYLTIPKENEKLILTNSEELKNNPSIIYGIDKAGDIYCCVNYQNKSKNNNWTWYGEGNLYDMNYKPIYRHDVPVNETEINYDFFNLDDNGFFLNDELNENDGIFY